MALPGRGLQFAGGAMGLDGYPQSERPRGPRVACGNRKMPRAIASVPLCLLPAGSVRRSSALVARRFDERRHLVEHPSPHGG